MGKFIVSEDFWELFPEAEIAIVSAKGIDNKGDFLEKLKSQINEVFSEDKEITINDWRKAYQNFKANQNITDSEALLETTAIISEAGKIDPLKDIYNSVSMTYGLPGRSDGIATFKGDMIFAKVKDGEPYLALADNKYDDTMPGEIVFIDDDGDMCRCWNWREGQRTIQTEDTADAFLIVESVDPNRRSDLKGAVDELARLIEKYLNGTTEIFYMNIKNKELKL
jgi:DNA/RNA-binding domain of Phe-tRNA-synthetase-like protein